MTTQPMSDDALLALAQSLFDQAAGEGANLDALHQLRDIFPAVLQRLREKVEITRDMVSLQYIDMADPRALDRLMKASAQPVSVDDQLEFPLSHF